VPVPTPALSIEKVLTSNDDEDGSGDVSVGDTLTYTITATNTGTANLTDVVVIDTMIVPGLTACALLAPGETCVLVGTYVVTAGDVEAGSIENTATADGDQTPPTEDDNEVIVQRDADLEIVKTATPDPIGAGNDITWTLKITNNGPGVALNVEVGDLMPSSVTVTKVSSSQFSCVNAGNTITCTKASMAAGETGTVTIVTNVPANSAGGTVTNVGTVESESPDPDLTNNSDDASVVVVAQAPPTTAPLPPVTLPKTGSDSTSGLVQGGIWLLMLGVAVLLVTRRRRHDELRHGSA
jgi:uncharacterized repeat protein (TIGR01451 family)/LPXTG-motif cell wall-anchored protein